MVDALVRAFWYGGPPPGQAQLNSLVLPVHVPGTPFSVGGGAAAAQAFTFSISDTLFDTTPIPSPDNTYTTTHYAFLKQLALVLVAPAVPGSTLSNAAVRLYTDLGFGMRLFYRANPNYINQAITPAAPPDFPGVDGILPVIPAGYQIVPTLATPGTVSTDDVSAGIWDPMGMLGNGGSSVIAPSMATYWDKRSSELALPGFTNDISQDLAPDQSFGLSPVPATAELILSSTDAGAGSCTVFGQLAWKGGSGTTIRVDATPNIAPGASGTTGRVIPPPPDAHGSGAVFLATSILVASGSIQNPVGAELILTSAGPVVSTPSTFVNPVRVSMFLDLVLGVTHAVTFLPASFPRQFSIVFTYSELALAGA